MYLVIDAPVIDYVFQPVADRLEAASVTQFQTARFFLDGAALFMVIALLLWSFEAHARWGTDLPWIGVGLMLMGVIFMTVIQRWFIGRVERLNKPGMMSAGRVVMFPARMIALSLLFTHGLDINLDPSWSHIVDFIAYIWWCLSCYFASCSQRPPKFQFSRKRSWFRFRPA